MTEVEFHTGVPDRVDFACRLLRKAARRGVRVLVTAPVAVLTELDRALWVFDERDFVPHVRVPGGAAAVRARTPIWLAADVASAPVEACPRVLVNLGGDVIGEHQAFDRLIEIVSSEPDDAEAGRGRWRAYRAQGLQVVHHQASDARA